MFEKFTRSWALVKASANVLSQDKELLVFPAVSSIAGLIVLATFALPLAGMGDLKSLGQDGQSVPMWLYAWGFVFYLCQYFVIFYFNTALVGAAMIRLDGGDPTVSDGLRIANSKLSTIFGYALIAATVGLILRAIEERAGWIGKWVTGLLGAAWTVASYLTVPVLVAQDVGPIEAVKQSALMLKRTWGENLIGAGGIGVVFGLIQTLVVIVSVFAIVAAISTRSLALIVTVSAIGLAVVLVVALIQAALTGIYSAALYRHANGEQAGGFEPALLTGAFRTK